MISSYEIDYKSFSTPLCEIGAKYDTDKSSQRRHVSAARHCHPYTCLYYTMFNHLRHEPICIGELGILHGASLRMWREFFPNAIIVGFEFDPVLIGAFKQEAERLDIELLFANVKDEQSLQTAFDGWKFDVFIEDSTHDMSDQLRAIQAVTPHIKPDGVLVVEDIFKSYRETDYGTFPDFQESFFVSLDHVNRCSTGWDNDKLFILTKSVPSLCFPIEKQLTVITNVSDPSNIPILMGNIDFQHVFTWIVVYSSPQTTFQYTDHPDICETYKLPTKYETRMICHIDEKSYVSPVFWTYFRLFVREGSNYDIGGQIILDVECQDAPCIVVSTRK